MSEKTKHTPGPWRLMEETYFHASRKDGTTVNTLPLIPIANAEDAFPAEVALVWKSKAFADRDEANARLVAAAPDLLAACKEWVDYFDTLSRYDEPGDRLAQERNRYHGPRVERTRTAIAKAEPKE